MKVGPEQPSSHLMLTEGTYQCLVIVFGAPLLLSHTVLGGPRFSRDELDQLHEQ